MSTSAQPCARPAGAHEPQELVRAAFELAKGHGAGRAVEEGGKLLRFMPEGWAWEFMDRYVANEPNFIQGHLGTLRFALPAGEWETVKPCPKPEGVVVYQAVRPSPSASVVVACCVRAYPVKGSIKRASPSRRSSLGRH